MKTKISIILFFGLFGHLLFAIEKPEVFGYFETQAMGSIMDNHFEQLYSNKLRVDLKGDLSPQVTFGVNVNWTTYHGKTQWDILDFLPESIQNQAQLVQVLGTKINPYLLPFEDSQILDNAYLKIQFDKLDVTLGKQQISLGTGYAWNPLDVFNTKDLFDPTYEQPGHNALRFDYALSNTMTATALYAPGSDWEASGKIAQIKSQVGRFDVALTAIEKEWIFHDYQQFDPIQMNFLVLPEKRRITGGSLVGELLGIGIYGEYAYNWMENTKEFQEWVVGGDYTFDSGTYLLMEFYRNTQGGKKPEEYTFNHWLRYFTAEQKAICQDQLYLYIQHPVTDLIYLGTSAIYSISDESVAILPTLNYSIFENVELLCYLNILIGDEKDTFYRNQGNGGLIRLRAYF